MSKLTIGDLQQRQAAPIEQKILLSRSKIKDWYDHWDGQVYLSFSGGKDSTVLLDIVRQMHLDIPAVYCNTGLEFPEVHEFAVANADVILQPKKTFKQVIEQCGWPVISKEQADYIHTIRHTKSEKMRELRLNGRGDGSHFHISDKWKFCLDAPFEIGSNCCNVMKKNPFKCYERKTGNKMITAMMACESNLRKQRYLKSGCNAFDGNRPSSMPLGFWTEQDILHYLKDNNLEYAAVYGDILEDDSGQLYLTGEPRTGCVFCAFGVHREEEPNKFQRLRETHPKLWDYCMNTLGEKEVLEFLNIPYE